MGSSLLLLALAGLAAAFPTEDPADGGKHWVVIVAGSNGWYNYRHQVRDAPPRPGRSTGLPNRARVLTLPLLPGRRLPCLPDRAPERDPGRADRGDDVRRPGAERSVSSLLCSTRTSAVNRI